VDQEDADRQEPRAKKESPCKLLSRAFSKLDPRFEHRQHQRQIPEGNHVDVRVDFRSAVFKEAPNRLKTQGDRPRISHRRRARRRR
jgi:hypothetical protein